MNENEILICTEMLCNNNKTFSEIIVIYNGERGGGGFQIFFILLHKNIF